MKILGALLGGVVLFTSMATATAAAAVVSRPSLTADDWTLNAEIECGNAESIGRAGPDHFVVSPREDAVALETQLSGVICSYVLSFQVTNKADKARRITIDVVIPGWMIKNELNRPFDYFLRRPYLWRKPEKLEWRELDPAHQANLDDRVRVQLDFAAGESRILSTTPAYPYTLACERLRELASKS